MPDLNYKLFDTLNRMRVYRGCTTTFLQITRQSLSAQPNRESVEAE